jgi:hypothetical protein
VLDVTEADNKPDNKPDSNTSNISNMDSKMDSKVGSKSDPAGDQRLVSPADFYTPSSSAGWSAPSSAGFEPPVGAKASTPLTPDDRDHDNHHDNHHDYRDHPDDLHRDRLNSEADFKDTSRPGTHNLAIREMFDDDDDDDRSEGDLEGRLEREGQEDAVTVQWVIMVDQFGITHAPPGRARALLTEQGFGRAMTVVHNERGAVEVVAADALLPSPAGVGRILKVTDFV